MRTKIIGLITADSTKQEVGQMRFAEDGAAPDAARH